MKLSPLGTRVLIKRDAVETKVGSIIIHSAIQEKSLTGVIVECGPGRLLDNGDTTTMNVTVGDKVMFTAGTGVDIKIKDEEFMVCKEEDLIGVFR